MDRSVRGSGSRTPTPKQSTRQVRISALSDRQKQGQNDCTNKKKQKNGEFYPPTPTQAREENVV